MSELFFYSIAGFFFGLLLFYNGLRAFTKKRLIENIPTSKIRSIAMGLVEVYGEVIPAQKPLKSPFSAMDCVYYNYKIQEHRSSGKHSYWATIKKGERASRFYLKDNTGSVLVDPEGADIAISKDNTFDSHLGKDPPKEVKKFLDSSGISFEGFLGMNKQMRYSESFIEPKDKLYVLGTAGDNPFFEEASSKKGIEDIMIKKGKEEKFYYISDKPELGILKLFAWTIALGIFGSLLSVVCLVVMLLYLGLL